jgi:hypothetical protein
MTWVATEVGSDHALRAWLRRGARQTSRRALAYRSAVDHEETATHDLQHHLYALIQPCQERSRVVFVPHGVVPPLP